MKACILNAVCMRLEGMKGGGWGCKPLPIRPRRNCNLLLLVFISNATQSNGISFTRPKEYRRSNKRETRCCLESHVYPRNINQIQVTSNGSCRREEMSCKHWFISSKLLSSVTAIFFICQNKSRATVCIDCIENQRNI